MPNLHLQNITIKELTDRNSNTYYLIVNNDNQDEAYFCFSGTVNQEGWTELENNWENIKEVEIEYSEKGSGLKVYRRVINLKVSSFKEVGDMF